MWTFIRVIDKDQVTFSYLRNTNIGYSSRRRFWYIIIIRICFFTLFYIVIVIIFIIDGRIARHSSGWVSIAKEGDISMVWVREGNERSLWRLIRHPNDKLLIFDTEIRYRTSSFPHSLSVFSSHQHPVLWL